MHLKRETDETGEDEGDRGGGEGGVSATSSHKMPPIPPPRRQRLIYSTTGVGGGGGGGGGGASSIYRVVEIDSISDEESKEWKRLPTTVTPNIKDGNFLY